MLPRISENCLVTAREELKELHVARPRQLHLWEAVTEQPQGVDQTVFVCVVATAIPTQAAAICHGRLDQHEAARKNACAALFKSHREATLRDQSAQARRIQRHRVRTFRCRLRPRNRA